MRKHREEEHEGKENSERWLLTYSDMITLLLALFIILYSMSSLEAEKFKEIADKFGSAFGSFGTGNGTGTGGGGGGAGAGDGSGIVDLDPDSIDFSGLAVQTAAPMDPLDKVYEALSEYVDDNGLQEEISLENADSYVRIRIKGVLMFYPDSPQMLESSQPIMQNISGALMEIYDLVDHITISGHTADVGELMEMNEELSWSLSINRANTVRNALVANGLGENKLSLEGYAHYAPISPNDSEVSRAKNRRAEITVYKHASGDETAESAEESEVSPSGEK